MSVAAEPQWKRSSRRPSHDSPRADSVACSLVATFSGPGVVIAKNTGQVLNLPRCKWRTKFGQCDKPLALITHTLAWYGSKVFDRTMNAPHPRHLSKHAWLLQPTFLEYTALAYVPGPEHRSRGNSWGEVIFAMT
ncbi:hypothetical protein PHLGIDRAFT_479528 [Phlebiopsis gigantea 11061_1 CR5-6]|uniref:Uncharacterized protein n=1 Tax=Phlebiopsis gigantea (strain 11061_1 CR5-6) TaxID=745531 RepID=A0A0C3S977_PHLG1|nr:hypothetical protein PHLGIDRAFT_479528 [Phlebiopsis gigantea 11061_1 CR5-6]